MKSLKNYNVQFWHNADCKCDVDVTATTELHAIAIALNDIGEPEWVNKKGRQILVEYKD